MVLTRNGTKRIKLLHSFCLDAKRIKKSRFSQGDFDFAALHQTTVLFLPNMCEIDYRCFNQRSPTLAHRCKNRPLSLQENQPSDNDFGKPKNPFYEALKGIEG